MWKSMPVLAGLAIVAAALVVASCSDDDTRPTTNAGASVSTRVVGKPLLFRFVGRQPSRVGDVATPRLRYTIIFRLNRDPKRPGDPDPRDVDPRVSATSRGNYRLAEDIVFAADAPIFSLGRRSAQHCFHGVLPEGRYPDLDRLPAGAPVKFIAQPLTPAAGRNKLGRRFVSHPRIMLTDINFRRTSARSALTKQGCLQSALQEYG